MDTLEKFEKSVTDEVNQMGAVILAALISNFQEMERFHLALSKLEKRLENEHKNRSSSLDEQYGYRWHRNDTIQAIWHSIIYKLK